MPGGSFFRPPAKLLKWIALAVFLLSLFFLLLKVVNRKNNQSQPLPTVSTIDSVRQPNPQEQVTDTLSIPKVALADSTLFTVKLTPKNGIKHRPAIRDTTHTPNEDTVKHATLDTNTLPVAVNIPVTATLQAPKDTLEPGSKGDFIIGALTGTPPFNLSLDMDKDGKEEWKGNQAGRVTLDLAKSGKFVAQLRVVDAKGLTSQVEATYVVNKKVKINLQCKTPKVNLVTPASFKAELYDGDDTLLSIQGFIPNHSGGVDTVPADKMEKTDNGQKIKAYWSRKWTKPGRYQVQVCGVASDARCACGAVQVEVFNAKPVCKILDDLKPMPGIPVAITGQAYDEDGSIVLWEWNLDGDNHFELPRKDRTPVHFTFARKGKFPLVFKATSADGDSCRDSLIVQVKSSW
jgi:hypothetical protein